MSKEHVLTEADARIAGECLELVGDCLMQLTNFGHQTGGLIEHYAFLCVWLRDQGGQRALKARIREISDMRSVLDDALVGKPAGEARIDASLRSSVCWVIWRTASLLTGKHDATALIWCRMAKASIAARYEGVTAPDHALADEKEEAT